MADKPQNTNGLHVTKISGSVIKTFLKFSSRLEGILHHLSFTQLAGTV